MKCLFYINNIKKKASKYHTFFLTVIGIIILLIFWWVWHYAGYEEGELKLYAVQANAEIMFAILEVIATFLMLKSIKQNSEANREMKKMNEKLQISMQEQTNVLLKQQEFYALQMKTKQEEIKQFEKTKTLNRYISYIRNFLFAYNRSEKFDDVNTKILQKNTNNLTEKEDMLKKILNIKLTPNQTLEQYFFEIENTENNKTITKLVFTKNDKDVKEKFDLLLREYKYKLRLKLHPILKDYFKNFETNEELQELCG